MTENLAQLDKGFRGTWPLDRRNSPRELVAGVQAVLEEYRAELPLTVRQIFYRLVAKGVTPKTANAASTLNNNLSKMRRAGYIDWRALRDDTIAEVKAHAGWYSAKVFLAAHRPNPNRFTKRLLDDQPYYIEVRCEAAGMIHQLAQVTEPKGIAVTGSGGTRVRGTARRMMTERTPRPIPRTTRSPKSNTRAWTTGTLSKSSRPASALAALQTSSSKKSESPSQRTRSRISADQAICHRLVSPDQVSIGRMTRT